MALARSLSGLKYDSSRLQRDVLLKNHWCLIISVVGCYNKGQCHMPGKPMNIRDPTLQHQYLHALDIVDSRPY